MDQQIYSGQAVVILGDDVVIKQFRDCREYCQEKQLLLALGPHSHQAIPQVIRYDDSRLAITMANAGQPLDNLDWHADRHTWARRIAVAMSPIWAVELDLPEYTATDKKGFDSVRDFLMAGYSAELSRAGVSDQLVKQAQRWLTMNMHKAWKEARGRSSVIHFDLSPRNVVIRDGVLTIIDWSRAMRSEPVFEMAILREKFDLIGEPSDYSAETPMADVNDAAADRIARSFRIYRQAKRVGRDLSFATYMDTFHAILDLLPLRSTKVINGGHLVELYETGRRHLIEAAYP